MQTKTEESHKLPWWARLSVADGLLLLLLLLAALVRVVQLGKIPLAEAEAELALSVWRLTQAVDGPMWLHSPAYIAFTAVFTQLLGFGDGVVRLVPALFGLGVVYLPWQLRHQLGNVGALAVSTFLAVSPLHIIVSRTAGGDSMALFALLLLLVAFVRYQETAVSYWPKVALMALALGLLSAPLFYTGLLGLVVALFVLAKMGLRVAGREQYVWPSQAEWRTAVVSGIALFALVGSCFFWLPAGLGGAAQLLGDWLAQFGGNGRSLVDPFLALLRYEPALWLFGLFAIVWALWRPSGLSLALIYWLLAGLLFLLLQGGQMSNSVLLTLPAYLLVGLWLNYLLSGQTPTWVTVGTATGWVIFAVIMVVNIGRFLRVVNTTTDTERQLFMPYIYMTLLAFFLALLLLYFVLVMDPTAVVQGVCLGTIVVFVVFHWGNGWWLGHEAANDPRERWVLTATDSNFRLLVETLYEFSYQFNRGTTDLDVATNIDTAVMHWYLRDFKKAQIGATVSALANNAVLITSAESLLQLEQPYSGADYRLTVAKDSDIPPLYMGLEQALHTLRWWFFHDGSAPLVYERVVLWVRADKLQPNP